MQEERDIRSVREGRDQTVSGPLEGLPHSLTMPPIAQTAEPFQADLSPNWLDRLTMGVVQAQRLVSEWVLVAMTLAIAAEVVCRSFLGFSLLVVEELAGYLLVALVFLGMGIATHENSLFRVEFVIKALPPVITEILLVIYRLLCLGFTLILLLQMYRLVVDSYDRGVSAATTLATPLYVPQIVMVIGAGTLALILVAQIVQSVRRVRRGAQQTGYARQGSAMKDMK